MSARVTKLQADVKRKDRELAQLKQKMAKVRRVLKVPLAVRRYLLRLKAGGGRRLRGLVGKGAVALPTATGPGPVTVGGAAATASLGQPVEAAATAARSGSGTAAAAAATPVWRDVLTASFKKWLTAAREAPGDEVVVMFSGTTFVQEHRGNRPIRLTNVYLERRCPVFFNYYRASEEEPLPQHPDKLLFQSPLDATQTYLDDLLTADFGGKKKVLFASFPHAMMVRYMALAAQHGWVTIYDARDDWEEFARVGMAKWYTAGFERYVATFADIATAVSGPLARKISMIAGGRTVHVVPNALDTRFPRPVGPRRPGRTPVIGYFGHLTDKWFDWKLVIAAAKRYPEFRFEMAGHQQPNLNYPPNIELLGLVGHAELAERSRTWSVALIPFKNGPLADAVDPIKIYEYLHLRIPVLASYFPQCRDYPGTTITEGTEEFLTKLGQLVGTELDEDEIAEWLSHNTWEQRVDEYSSLAEDVRRGARDNVMALVGGEL
jgi:glycosyltransferase involved in cell wall biosynthesis